MEPSLHPFAPGQSVGPDIANERVQRERLLAQDERILSAVRSLSESIQACGNDPEFPESKPRALVIGGFVRDALLGKYPTDVDVEVYGLSAARLEKLLDEMFPGKVNKVGKTFGIFNVSLADGIELDISLPRRESKVGEGHKGFVVDGDPTMSLEEAARRRDFTINSVAADLLTGEIFDPFDGIADLKARTLRVTDPECFQDDALRIYRALQFAARMDLTPDSETIRLMREMVERGELSMLVEPKRLAELREVGSLNQLIDRGDIVGIKKGEAQKGLTSPRITEEWRKLLSKAEKPSVGLELAKRLGILERFYPEICTQDESAWPRLTQSIDAAARLIKTSMGTSTKDRDDQTLQVMLGTLFSNFGPADATPEERQRFAEAFYLRHDFNLEKISKPAACAAREHAEPQRILDEFMSGESDERLRDNEIRKLFKRSHPVEPWVLAIVARAMTQGAGTSDDPVFPAGEMILDCAARHLEWLLSLNQMYLVTGEELQARGIEGPRIGELQKIIEEARDRGEIEAHEEALAYLETIK
ncbi:MAG: hypothetical protein RDU25_01700 [Patescibacteria group bacterium]|nr:hypothetical protein [Patescibacteria group bacterium]